MVKKRYTSKGFRQYGLGLEKTDLNKKIPISIGSCHCKIKKVIYLSDSCILKPVDCVTVDIILLITIEFNLNLHKTARKNGSFESIKRCLLVTTTLAYR